MKFSFGASSTLATQITDGAPADVFASASPKNMTAGAPLVICVASVELAPKLNFTVSPGWAASNWSPSLVKVSFSDDAAKTVIVPVAAAELLVAGDDDGLLAAGAELVLLEQPARAAPATAAMMRAKRRMVNSLVK